MESTDLQERINAAYIDFALPRPQALPSSTFFSSTCSNIEDYVSTVMLDRDSRDQFSKS